MSRDLTRLYNKKVAESFPNWLNKQFLEWQLSNGRATLQDFADYLEIKRPILSHYMSGRNVPRGENLSKIAGKLGNEAYDLLGYVRPDEGLKELTKLYSDIPDEDKEAFLELIREYKKQHRIE